MKLANSCSSMTSAWPNSTKSAVAICSIIRIWKVGYVLNYEFEHLTTIAPLYERTSGSNIASGVKLKLDTMKCEQKKKRKSRLKNRSSRRKQHNNRNYDASNSAGAVDFDFQADQSTPQCRWEMETSEASRPLCAVLGSGDMFRVKNFEGIPYTQCPLNDGAIPIIELPYLLVMGSISKQKLTKVRERGNV